MAQRALCVLVASTVVAACTSSGASASQDRLNVHVARAGDATVVQLRDAAGVARGVVRWGDGRSTVVSRACGTRGDHGASALFAPHLFRRAGTYHGVAYVSRACKGAEVDRRRVSFVVRAAAPRHASAVAAASEVASSDEWTSFDQPYVLEDSELTYIQGAVTAGNGCKVPGGSLSSEDVAPGATSVELREDAIDPTTCTYLYETGTPPADADAVTDGSSDGSSTATATTPPPAEGSAVAHSAAAHSAHLYTAWRDPINITVNSMRQVENWTYNGSCVLSSSGTATWTWYSPSGWFDYGGTHSNGRTCNHGIDTVYHAMGNHTFCVGGLVNSFYNVNNLAGHGDGGWAANWNDYNTGAVCKSLLHFAQDAGYGG